MAMWIAPPPAPDPRNDPGRPVPDGDPWVAYTCAGLVFAVWGLLMWGLS